MFVRPSIAHFSSPLCCTVVYVHISVTHNVSRWWVSGMFYAQQTQRHMEEAGTKHIPGTAEAIKSRNDLEVYQVYEYSSTRVPGQERENKLWPVCCDTGTANNIAYSY